MLAGLADRLSRLPLRWRIGGLVLVGLIAVFVPFGVLGFEIAEDGRQHTVADWQSITATTAGYIDAQLEQRFARLEWTAALVGAAPDAARQRQILDDTLGQDESFVPGAFLIDRSGAVVWSRSGNAAVAADAIAGQPGVLDPLTTGARYASGVERLGPRPAAILAVPVRSADGRVTAELALLLQPDQGALADLVTTARGLAHSGHAELVDQYDHVLASTDATDVLGPGEHPDFYEPLLAARHSAVGMTAPVGAQDPVDEGQVHEMAFVPLRTVPWGLALGGSDAELSANANRWQREIVALAAITLGLAALLVWLTTRSVARPILALAAASRQIAAGDLGTPVPLEGEGEVRVLAQAFDQMRRELQGALSALALEESRYEGIVTSMADAVVTTDPALRITAFNPAAAALTGWAADAAIGRLGCEVICAEASVETCGKPCALLLPEPEAGFAKETLRRRDGAPVAVAISRSPIRDEAGRVAGTVHVLRDITAETEIDRLKDEFLSTVSHELRTPLGFIMGYATTMLLPDAQLDRAATRRCVQVIAEASVELKELVDNLLDMTRIGSGSLSVSPVSNDLRPLVRHAVDRIRVRGQGHRFATSVPGALPKVLADPHRLEQVLYNLLDNAIKYSPNGGRIRVDAAIAGDEIVVSVVDDGLGVPPDELPKLFQRFHRGEGARARGIAGTGLGLAICRGIVEAHGGRIWAESPPAGPRAASGGTAVRFTIPIARAVAA